MPHWAAAGLRCLVAGLAGLALFLAVLSAAAQEPPPPTAAPAATPRPPAALNLRRTPVITFAAEGASAVAPPGIRAAIGVAKREHPPSVCPAGAGGPSLAPAGAPYPYEAPAWNKPLNLVSCGWSPGEVVTMQARLPDGRVVSLGQAPADDKGRLETVYAGARADPFGTHRFTFSGAAGAAAWSVPLPRPAGARLYLQADGVLFLFGFKAAEPVSLFEYCEQEDSAATGSLPLTQWQTLTVDARGQLLVQLTRLVLPAESGPQAYTDRSGRYTCDYFAVGGASGETHVAGAWTEASYRPITAQGVAAVKADTGGDRLRVRAEPSRLAPELARVPADAQLPAAAAFVQEDGLWWRVELPDGRTGWVMDRFVERIPR
jgi:hypothetical protein